MPTPPRNDADNKPPVLRPGSQGEEVTKLQERLNGLGYHLDEDGVYGPRTTAAVTHLQQRSGVAVDGTAGPQTQAAITQHIDAHHNHLGDNWEREVRAAHGGADGHHAQDGAVIDLGQLPAPVPEKPVDLAAETGGCGAAGIEVEVVASAEVSEAASLVADHDDGHHLVGTDSDSAHLAHAGDGHGHDHHDGHDDDHTGSHDA